MTLDFRIFAEMRTDDGYGLGPWNEVTLSNGFVSGFCDQYDGYITEELFIGLSNISDLQFSTLFRRKLPNDISTTLMYKLSMLECLGKNNKYYLTLQEMNNFNWDNSIYSSVVTVKTSFRQVAQDFLTYVLPALAELGLPENVRMIIFKKE